jgi:hypothetical protein
VIAAGEIGTELGVELLSHRKPPIAAVSTVKRLIRLRRSTRAISPRLPETPSRRGSMGLCTKPFSLKNDGHGGTCFRSSD